MLWSVRLLGTQNTCAAFSRLDPNSCQETVFILGATGKQQRRGTRGQAAAQGAWLLAQRTRAQGCRRGLGSAGRRGKAQLRPSPPRRLPARAPASAALLQRLPAEPGPASLSPASFSSGLAVLLPLAFGPRTPHPRGFLPAGRLRAMLPGQDSLGV
jgi:hypothetical protein